MASMKSSYIPTNDDHQESMEESRATGLRSPPPWQNHRQSPPNHNCISPNSRLQAIVRSQSHLMELVKSMPESSYELSLTDLVENHKPETRVPPLLGPDNDRKLRRRSSQESRKSDRITRSASFENRGLLLKMVFPVGFPARRKKSLDRNTGGRAESSRYAWSSDSDSSRTSGSSGYHQDSIRLRKRNNGVVGNCCWPFFQSSRRESVD